MDFIKIIRDVLLILLTILLIFFTFLSIISLIEYIGFPTNDWLEIIGAGIGVMGAYLVFTLETWSRKKQKKIDDAPRVVINNQRYNDCWFEFGFDFLEEKNEVTFSDFYTAYSNKYSNLTLPLINAGRTPVFNISIKMDIDSIDDNLDELELSENHSVFNYTKINDKEIRIKEKVEREARTFSFNKRYYLKNHQYDGIPSLMPSENIMIPLPMAYIKIIQYILSPGHSKNYDKLKTVRPVLKIKVNYDDYNFKSKEENFYITYDYDGYNFAFRKNEVEDQDQIRRIYLNLIFKSYPEKNIIT